MLTKIKTLLEKANGKLKELHEWCIEHCFISMLIPLITLLLIFTRYCGTGLRAGVELRLSVVG